MATLCLLGVVHADGRTYTAVPVTHGGDPAHIVAVARQIWRTSVDGDTHALVQRVLARWWQRLDPIGAATPHSTYPVPGVGYAIAASPDPVQQDLHVPGMPSGAELAVPDRPRRRPPDRLRGQRARQVAVPQPPSTGRHARRSTPQPGTGRR